MLNNLQENNLFFSPPVKVVGFVAAEQEAHLHLVNSFIPEDMNYRCESQSLYCQRQISDSAE